MQTILLSLLIGGPANAGTLRVDMLDIGQGDAFLLRTPAGKTILIDAGDGKYDVVPMLRDRGVKSLDLVIATHAHSDHIGGMDEVLDGVPIKLYVDQGLPHTTRTYAMVMERVESHGVAYKTGGAGQLFRLDDGIEIALLGPPKIPLKDTRSDLNSNSVVARVTHGENCFLFTGDAEEPTERWLLRQGMEPCEVLKVAHHGSSHSTTDAWLRAVAPEIALISLGEGNPYGHPSRETLGRLERAGAQVYRTDKHGSVTVFSDGKKLTVQAGQARAAAPAGPTVDINAASAGELENLPGIGASKAAAIVAYRDQHGAFASVDQLEAVSGIGPSTVERLRTQATVGGAVAASATTAPSNAGSSGTGHSSAGTSASGGGKIDINTAGASALEALPGIGPSKAGAIVADREANGPFATCEELDRVRGIGPATVAGLRDKCAVAP